MRNDCFFQDQQGRLDAVTPQQWKEGFLELSNYLTRKLKGRTHNGPFSKEALGCRAVEYISKRAYDILIDGQCRWPPEVDLATQLCRNAKSEMERLEHEWEQHQPPTALEMQRQVEADQRAQAHAKLMAYRIARYCASGNPRLLEFIDCMEANPDRKVIARRMKIPLEQVQELERELLKCVTAE